MQPDDAPCYNRFGTCGAIFEYLPGISSGYRAVTGTAERYGAFDDHDVVSEIFFYGFFPQSLGLFSGSSHQRVGIFERNHVEKDLTHERVGGSYE